MSEALELEVNGHQMKFSAAQHDNFKALGITPEWLTSLIGVFGPKLSDILIRLILKKGQEVQDPTKFRGVFDALGIDYLRNLLADLLLTYKDTVGDVVEAWVESGIEALADAIDTR